MAMVLPATIPRGQTLRDYRERACLTQSELAALARCSRFSVTKIELGQVAPSMRVRRHIAAALGVGPDKVAWPRRIARVTPED